ncbi:aspartyl protease family protein [Horticoccus sp. 23ND18S-11]|uniref:aspartyl protease family protein n=1 Tax=Horticoccus sp. 23ND18S-11 TaxID=3391832 RepID=UPI0039C94252
MCAWLRSFSNRPASSLSRHLSPVSCRPSPVTCFLFLSVLFITGCTWPGSRRPSLPGRTTLSSPLVILPAQTIGNYLLIEAKWDRYGPYHFLIDTGSSVTLVTPALARRYPGREGPGAPAGTVRVTGANGGVTELPRGSLRRLELGDARFEDVDVLLYDCAPLSAHLGVRIDGVLGFPLFRETLLTLDYPGSRVVLQPARSSLLVPGTNIAFNDARKTPLINVRLGDRSLVVLIDSLSDATFSLNPVGLAPRFAYGPKVGATVGTISGDRIQRVGRLGETVAIGDYAFTQPVVDVTDELSAIGGGMLKYFSVTFDQLHDRVTFYRDARDPIVTPPQRSAGISFNKTPAYWRVAGVVPQSSAEAAGVQPGDLVIRINGDPVAKWDLRRYEQLIATSGELVLTFLNGTTESEKRVSVFELVP